MKNKLLLRAFMSLVFVLMGAAAWAETKTGTITFGTNNVKISAASVTGNDNLGNSWTITTEGTTSFTANASYYQVGSSNKPATSISFTTTLPEEVAISQVSAKFGGFNGTAGTITIKVGDTSIGSGSLNAATDVTVTGSPASPVKSKVITITVTGIAKGVKVYNISYTYGEESESVGSISVNTDNAVTEFWKGDAFSSEGVKVVDDKNNDVSSKALFSGYNMNEAGEQTVTVSYGGKTATYKITVRTIANTQATAYTIAKAIELIDAGKDLSTEVYVRGTISQVDSYNSTYGSITYWITEPETEVSFEIYGGLNEDGGKFTSLDDLQIGDAVIVKGVIKKFGDTYEMDKNNVLVDLQRSEATLTGIAISGAPTKTSYCIGESFDPSGLILTATYSDGTTLNVTASADWTIYPEVFETTGDEVKVDVMAGYQDQSSEISSYTVSVTKKTAHITAADIELGKGQSATIAASIDLEEATLSYAIKSGAEVIDLSAEGVLTAKAAGSAVVSISFAGNDSYAPVSQDINVTVGEYVIATIGSFSATSGHIDSNISYEAFKGNSSTDPAIQSGCLRLYQNGGYVTISGAAGVTIKSVTLTTGSSYASTTIGTAIDDAEAPTTGEAVTKNTDFSLDDLSAHSVSFYCLGTDKNTRLDVAKLVVKYTKEDVELSAIELSGTYKTEYIQHQTFDKTGVVVTASYNGVSGTKDVSDDAEFSTPDMAVAGSQTITVSYTEGGITKTADYTITIAEEFLTGISVAKGEGVQTRYTVGDDFNTTGITATATYNSGRTADIPAADLSFTGYDLSQEGKQKVVVAYGGKEDTYGIVVLSQDVLFYESFDACTGTGGNDNQWSGSIASSTLVADNEGWTHNGNGAAQSAKFGTGSKQGSAQMPALGYKGDAVLSFRAAAWSGNSEERTIKLSVEGGGTIQAAEGVAAGGTVTMTKGAWTDYTVTIKGLTATSRIKFEATVASNNRFFLDEVMLKKASAPLEGDYNADGKVSVADLTTVIAGLQDASYTMDDLQVVLKALGMEEETAE